MLDLKWLEDDKKLFCAVPIEYAKHAQIVIDALNRAHAHIDELHEVFNRFLSGGAYKRFIEIWQDPPEVK
jgi:hypothetical protein